MSIFSGLTQEGLEETQDRLGGFQPLETDAYDLEIKVAYAGQSEGGARNVTIVGDIDGREYRETIYVTNKKGENFFLNQNDNTKKVPLPGFTVVDDICLVTTEKPLAEQATEEKVVKIYDFEQRKEIPTSVPVLVDLVGKMVTLGIGQQLVNKNVKNQSTGKYEPTADTRVENVIEKVFHHGTKMTVVEARNGKTEAEFYPLWVERNKGQQRDRRKLKDGGDAGSSGRPQAGPPASGSEATRKSLFGGS
jgi:hypothetical protein